MARLLGYDPAKRPRPLVACLDPYFDELRDPNTRLPNGAPLPHLFNFTEGKLTPVTLKYRFMSIEEKHDDPEACAQLVPAWWAEQ